MLFAVRADHGAVCAPLVFVTGPMINALSAVFRRLVKAVHSLQPIRQTSQLNFSIEYSQIKPQKWLIMCFDYLYRYLTATAAYLGSCNFANPQMRSQFPNRWSASLATLQKRMEHTELHLNSRVNRLWWLQAKIREPHLGRRRVLWVKTAGDRQIGRLQRPGLDQAGADLVLDFHFWPTLFLSFQRFVVYWKSALWIHSKLTLNTHYLHVFSTPLTRCEEQRKGGLGNCNCPLFHPNHTADAWRFPGRRRFGRLLLSLPTVRQAARTGRLDGSSCVSIQIWCSPKIRTYRIREISRFVKRLTNFAPFLFSQVFYSVGVGFGGRLSLGTVFNSEVFVW